MQRISALMRPFSLSDIPSEVRERTARAYREHEERERERVWRERLERSQIPEEFQGASIDLFPALKSWASGFGERKDEKPEGNILLLGIAGCGKTYTACGIALTALRGCPSVRFVTASSYLRELREAMDGRAVQADVFSRYASCKLLILDDLGKGNPTEWSAESFFDLINKRQESGKRTVITTQYNERTLARRISAGSDIETAQALTSRLFARNGTWEQIVPGNVDRRRHG